MERNNRWWSIDEKINMDKHLSTNIQHPLPRQLFKMIFLFLRWGLLVAIRGKTPIFQLTKKLLRWQDLPEQLEFLVMIWCRSFFGEWISWGGVFVGGNSCWLYQGNLGWRTEFTWFIYLYIYISIYIYTCMFSCILCHFIIYSISLYYEFCISFPYLHMYIYNHLHVYVVNQDIFVSRWPAGKTTCLHLFWRADGIPSWSMWTNGSPKMSKKGQKAKFKVENGRGTHFCRIFWREIQDFIRLDSALGGKTHVSIHWGLQCRWRWVLALCSMCGVSVVN